MVVSTGVGNHQMMSCQFIRWTQPRSIITSGSLGTMGFGLPAAIGAQVTPPLSLSLTLTLSLTPTLNHNPHPHPHPTLPLPLPLPLTRRCARCTGRAWTSTSSS